MIRLCFFYVLTVHAELYVSTEWNTNGHCYGNDANATLSVDHCQRQVASYISEEVVAPGDYAPQYRTTIIRKFNHTIATCAGKAGSKLKWKTSNATVDVVECTNCSRLELPLVLRENEFTSFTCHAEDVDEPARFPDNDDFDLSWFECCNGKTFVFTKQREDTIIRPLPEAKPLIPEESLDQMLYGTLTGFGLFVVIVVGCWILIQHVEREKAKKKKAEQEAAKKRKKEKDTDSNSDDIV